MKTIFLLLVIGLFVAGATVCALAVDAMRVTVDRKTFLRAIGAIESGDRDSARGQAGERGRYQLTRAVWEQHCKADFKHAHRRVFAYAIAEKHFDWLVGGLLAAELPADVEHLALCWNAGLSAVVNNRIPAPSREYAERVGNLYADFNKQAEGAK